MRKFGVLAIGIQTLALAAALQPSEARADTVSDALQMCAGCHGENGVPIDKTTPVIAGQKRAYILNQLLDFKNGRRKSEIMTPMVEALSKADMEAIASHYSAMPWPDLKQEPAAAEVRTAGLDILEQYNCAACHHRHFEGDSIRPRLAGQNDEYLVNTMTAFRDHARANYATMSAIVRNISDDELKAVAAYLATMPPAVAQK